MKKEYTAVKIYRETKKLLDIAASKQSDRKKPAVWHDLISNAVRADYIPDAKHDDIAATKKA